MLRFYLYLSDQLSILTVTLQIKAVLKDRLNGKANGGSTDKSEPSASVELNSRNFDELVLKSKELWIVEFFAPWYAPCASDDFSDLVHLPWLSFLGNQYSSILPP